MPGSGRAFFIREDVFANGSHGDPEVHPKLISVSPLDE